MKYVLKLTYAGPINDLRDKQEILMAAQAEYNSKKYQMQIPKTIYFTESDISEKNIILILDSALPLPSPGKGLRAFSAYLNDKGFEASKSGQLFRTELLQSSESTSEQPEISAHANDISDIDFLKSLLDYVYKKSDGGLTEYKRKNTAFQQMKSIAIDSGIIKLKDD